MIYKFEAEHISRSTGVALVHKLEGNDVDVNFADVGRTFTNQLTMVVTVADEAAAKVIRDCIWEVNNGACCEMDTITADELETYL